MKKRLANMSEKITMCKGERKYEEGRLGNIKTTNNGGERVRPFKRINEE